MMEKLKFIYNYNCTYCQNCGNLFKNLRNNKSTCMDCRKTKGKPAWNKSSSCKGKYKNDCVINSYLEKFYVF